MPTYEYACTACGHRLDAVQSFTDDPLTVCPECGGILRKVYGAVGIAFKGSGFYKTDSRAGSARSNGDAKKAGDGASTSGDTSSDSTPAKESPKPGADGGSASKEAAKPAKATPAASAAG